MQTGSSPISTTIIIIYYNFELVFNTKEDEWYGVSMEVGNAHTIDIQWGYKTEVGDCPH